MKLLTSFLAYIFLVFFMIGPYSASSTEPSEESSSFRLPNTTRPIAYDVSIKTRIHAADFSFYGTVKIEIIADESTSSITIHQLYLNIERIILLQSNGSNLPIGQYSYDSLRQFLTITTLEPLTNGSRYDLQIDYNGTLRTDDSGFYRSSYVNDNGERIWLATTQFQLADARHAFPCYDEPGLKAFFTIRITHDESYSAISNMPVSYVVRK